MQIQLPQDLKISLHAWAEQEADEDADIRHIVGICCTRLAQLTPEELKHWLRVARLSKDWAGVFTALGPPV